MPIMKSVRKIKAFGFVTMSISTILAGCNFLYVKTNGKFEYRVGHFDAPWGITFHIGYIEAIMGVLFTIVATLIIWYSFFSIDKEIKENRISLYYLLINILVGSLLGMVFTDDLFNAFVFLEVSTLAGCGIIVIKDKKDNITATFKYLVLSSLGSGLILMGIAFLYPITGHLNMSLIHESIMALKGAHRNILLISVSTFTVGLGVKSAMFPLHVWLPDAHASAPTSSSAILSGLVLKPPVILLMKILYKVFGFEIIGSFAILDVILILGSIGMIVGSIAAILQKEIKRMIAYSSVAQMGYVFFGIGLGNELGLIMAIFHIISHAVTKSTLFLVVGAMIEKTGSKKIKDLKGIGKEMPITLGVFTMGALSMVGIPIFPGFISKWNLALATIETGRYMFVGMILLSSLLNVGYYFPIVINGYFGEENLEGKVYKSKVMPMKRLIPVFILVGLMVMTGVFSLNIIDMIRQGLV
ncbi:monovalent cation/H+ antiporter subunit D family protein [Lutibacter sp. B2]|nr:monovalent cation/H+ antiporter subunit D family protein [Lutibacter sp. B2]